MKIGDIVISKSTGNITSHKGRVSDRKMTRGEEGKIEEIHSNRYYLRLLDGSFVIRRQTCIKLKEKAEINYQIY